MNQLNRLLKYLKCVSLASILGSDNSNNDYTEICNVLNNECKKLIKSKFISTSIQWLFTNKVTGQLLSNIFVMKKNTLTIMDKNKPTTKQIFVIHIKDGIPSLEEYNESMSSKNHDDNQDNNTSHKNEKEKEQEQEQKKEEEGKNTLENNSDSKEEQEPQQEINMNQKPNDNDKPDNVKQDELQQQEQKKEDEDEANNETISNTDTDTITTTKMQKTADNSYDNNHEAEEYVQEYNFYTQSIFNGTEVSSHNSVVEFLLHNYIYDPEKDKAHCKGRAGKLYAGLEKEHKSGTDIFFLKHVLDLGFLKWSIVPCIISIKGAAPGVELRSAHFNLNFPQWLGSFFIDANYDSLSDKLLDNNEDASSILKVKFGKPFNCPYTYNPINIFAECARYNSADASIASSSGVQLGVSTKVNKNILPSTVKEIDLNLAIQEQNYQSSILSFETKNVNLKAEAQLIDTMPVIGGCIFSLKCMVGKKNFTQPMWGINISTDR